MSTRLDVTAAQAAAFRLARHRLTAGSAESLADVVGATAGIQAQVQSSAEMAIWTRRRSTTRDEVRRALWETRDLVKTSAMRVTLHILPARDFAIYIAAMRPTSMAMLARWHARIGATPQQVRALIDTIVESLADGPKTQQELIARARKRAGKAIRLWLENAWSGVRPAVIDGAIVYGPPNGSSATFVRADEWVGRQKLPDPDAARAELLRRFLAAFGPATAHDFAKWSGLSMIDARAAVDGVRGELVDVSVDGAPGLIRRADARELAASELDRGAVRLLGAFDSFLLAHATKEHLVERRYYKRVYRPQGWISAVVLQGGEIIGVWTPRATARTMAIEVELFGRAGATVRRAIGREVDEMSAFLGTRTAVRFG
jgi:winged helix DNA-binding protein